jgi:hypothetical protein
VRYSSAGAGRFRLAFKMSYPVTSSISLAFQT